MKLLYAHWLDFELTRCVSKPLVFLLVAQALNRGALDEKARGRRSAPSFFTIRSVFQKRQKASAISIVN